MLLHDLDTEVNVSMPNELSKRIYSLPQTVTGTDGHQTLAFVLPHSSLVVAMFYWILGRQRHKTFCWSLLKQFMSEVSLLVCAKHEENVQLRCCCFFWEFFFLSSWCVQVDKIHGKSTHKICQTCTQIRKWHAK